MSDSQTMDMSGVLDLREGKVKGDIPIATEKIIDPHLVIEVVAVHPTMEHLQTAMLSLKDSQ
jgi:hypothetical protein